MSRIHRPQMWMMMAEVAAMRSTCCRANNGATLVSKSGRHVSVGYNGPPPKHPHCTGNSCVPAGQTGCTRSVHAEENAITRAGEWVTGATIYCTMSPCLKCAELIARSGIVAVFFRYPYRSDLGVELLNTHHIPCYRITQNGDIMAATGPQAGQLVTEDFE